MSPDQDRDINDIDGDGRNAAPPPLPTFGARVDRNEDTQAIERLIQAYAQSIDRADTALAE